jgi:hypothetical protein
MKAIEPPPGQLHLPGALVEAGDDGAPVAQRREQGPGAAAGVEDPPVGHVPGEGQHRGPLVISIEEAGLVLVSDLVRQPRRPKSHDHERAAAPGWPIRA